MKRCETLVVTRDDAKAALKHFTDEVHVQETELAEFKEAQNEKILQLRQVVRGSESIQCCNDTLVFLVWDPHNFSSKQNTLQDALYQIQAKKDSKQRLIDQKGEG